MRSTIVFAAVLATAFAAPAPSIEVVQIRQILRRVPVPVPAVSSIDLSTLVPSGCLPPTSGLPELPSAVETALATYDGCASLTGSVGSEFTSYTSAVSSWWGEHSAELESWASAYTTACPLASLAGSYSAPDILPTNTADLFGFGCSTGAAAGTSKAAGTTGGAGTSKAAGTTGGAASAKGTGASTGAAPQKTAFAKAVGIMAGVAGVVAAL